MVQTTLRIPESAYRELKRIANIRGLTLNAVINNVLWEFVRREKDESKERIK